MTDLLNVIQYGEASTGRNHPSDIIRIDTFVLSESFSSPALKIHNPSVKRLVFSCNSPCWVSILESEDGVPGNSNKILLTQNSLHSFKIRNDQATYIKAASVATE
jgi:hypothetical protein